MCSWLWRRNLPEGAYQYRREGALTSGQYRRGGTHHGSIQQGGGTHPGSTQEGGALTPAEYRRGGHSPRVGSIKDPMCLWLLKRIYPRGCINARGGAPIPGQYRGGGTHPMYVCKDSAAPPHARTRAHRPAVPRQNSGVSQTPHPTAFPQAGIPHRPP